MKIIQWKKVLDESLLNELISLNYVHSEKKLPKEHKKFAKIGEFFLTATEKQKNKIESKMHESSVFSSNHFIVIAFTKLMAFVVVVPGDFFLYDFVIQGSLSVILVLNKSLI